MTTLEVFYHVNISSMILLLVGHFDMCLQSHQNMFEHTIMESIYENYNAKPVCLAFEWTHNVLPFLTIENWFKPFKNQIIYGHKLLLQSNIAFRNGS